MNHFNTHKNESLRSFSMHNMRVAQPYLIKLDWIFVQDWEWRYLQNRCKEHCMEEKLPLLTYFKDMLANTVFSIYLIMNLIFTRLCILDNKSFLWQHMQCAILIPDMQTGSPGLSPGSRALTELLLSFSSIQSVILHIFPGFLARSGWTLYRWEVS